MYARSWLSLAYISDKIIANIIIRLHFTIKLKQAAKGWRGPEKEECIQMLSKNHTCLFALEKITHSF